MREHAIIAVGFTMIGLLLFSALSKRNAALSKLHECQLLTIAPSSHD